MIEAVVRKASIRKAPSGLGEVAATQEVEPATLVGAKRPPSTRGGKIDTESPTIWLWSGREAWVPLSCQLTFEATWPPSQAARFSPQPAPETPSIAFFCSSRKTSIALS